MMLSDVCPSDVCHVHPVGGRRVRPGRLDGAYSLIGLGRPGSRLSLRASAAGLHGRGHIVAAARLQLVQWTVEPWRRYALY